MQVLLEQIDSLRQTIDRQGLMLARMMEVVGGGDKNPFFVETGKSVTRPIHFGENGDRDGED